MTRIQTPITGITTTSTYEEGSSYSLVNLRPKNGALHPVAPRKVVQQLSQKYDIVFVHQNNDYKNWIGVINEESYSSIFWDILDEEPKSIQNYVIGNIHSIEQIGNTVSLVTESNIFYLFYNNGNYTYLGELPQIPLITLATSSEMSHAPLYFKSEYPGGVKPDYFIDATKGLVNKAMDILVNGGLDEEGNPIGGYGLQLFDAHFIRYAFRLYDGTVTKHSPPILVMPIKNILDIKTIDYSFLEGSLFLSYDGYPISKVDVYGYRIYMNYDFTSLGGDNYTKWNDIIESVDIFLSQPVGLSNIENIRKDMPTTDQSSGAPLRHYNLIKDLTTEDFDNVKNTSNFYLIRSIPLGQMSMDDQLPSENKDTITKLENLIYQEVMSDDNFSNHKYGANVSYAYNSRLHLADIKTTFFNGFNMGYFQWWGSYNGVPLPTDEGITALVAEVEIQAGTSLAKVYSSFSTYIYAPKLFASAFLSYPDPRARRITIYEVLSDGTWMKVFSEPLQRHNLLNLSYYLSNDLTPIVGDDAPPEVIPPITTKTVTLLEPNKIKVSELNNPLSFPNTNTYQSGNGIIRAMATNAMNVSDRNYGQYPLYIFTTQGIWTLNVGNDEVVYSTQSAPTYTEAPTTSIVCSVPFGVVFTTLRGLMIINGQSVDFISPQLEQDPLLFNMQMPVQTEGVVFQFPQKSFKDYLNGLDNLTYNPHEGELIISDKESDYNYVLNFNTRSFYQSTEKVDFAVGNVFPELLVISDKSLKNYAVSNVPDTHISIILRPLLYGTPDIKKLERMILRAILYNVQNPSEGKFPVIMTHHSNDGINFPATRGLPLPVGNIKDKDMGLFASSKFRQFMFTIAGVVDEKSQIQFLETMIDTEYNNGKMR